MILWGMICFHSSVQTNKRNERSVWRLKAEVRLTGCGQYMMLWVRVLVKWSQRPRRSLTLNFSGFVCIWWPLTLAPGTCLRSLLSISDASAGARTSHTYQHTLRRSEAEDKSTPLLLLIHTDTNRLHRRRWRWRAAHAQLLLIQPRPATDDHSRQHDHVHAHLNTLIKQSAPLTSNHGRLCLFIFQVQWPIELPNIKSRQHKHSLFSSSANFDTLAWGHPPPLKTVKNTLICT